MQYKKFAFSSTIPQNHYIRFQTISIYTSFTGFLFHFTSFVHYFFSSLFGSFLHIFIIFIVTYFFLTRILSPKTRFEFLFFVFRHNFFLFLHCLDFFHFSFFILVNNFGSHSKSIDNIISIL